MQRPGYGVPLHPEQELQPHPNQPKNGRQPDVHVSTKTRLARHEQFVMDGVWSQEHVQHIGVHGLHAHGLYNVKQRDRVPTDVST